MNARARATERPVGTPCGPECRKPTPSQAHCATDRCHRTFSGPSYFDDHRRDGRCVDPAELGLVDVDGLWASPEGHAKRAADAERLAAHRATGADE